MIPGSKKNCCPENCKKPHAKKNHALYSKPFALYFVVPEKYLKMILLLKSDISRTHNAHHKRKPDTDQFKICHGLSHGISYGSAIIKQHETSDDNRHRHMKRN